MAIMRGVASDFNPTREATSHWIWMDAEANLAFFSTCNPSKYFDSRLTLDCRMAKLTRETLSPVAAVM